MWGKRARSQKKSPNSPFVNSALSWAWFRALRWRRSIGVGGDLRFIYAQGGFPAFFQGNTKATPG
jgi:hypothetical protein